MQRPHTPADSPMRLHVDNRSLLIDGSQGLLCGDSVTHGWMELGADWNAQAYLQALRQAGANAVMIWAYIGITDQVSDHRVGIRTTPYWPWKYMDGRFRPEEPDTRYDSALRRFLTLAAANNLAVIVTIHDGWTKTRFAGHPCNRALGGFLTRKEDYVQLQRPGVPLKQPPDPTAPPIAHHQFVLEQFTKRVCRAANGMQHVIFEILNEGEWYPREACIRFNDHFARFVRAHGPWPIMINHPAFQKSDIPDLISVHTPLCDNTCTALSAWAEHTRMRRASDHPVVLSETVPEYAGGETELRQLARLAWGAALAGSHLLLQNDCSFGWHPGVAMAAKRKNAFPVYRLEGAIRRILAEATGRAAGPAPELCDPPTPMYALKDRSHIWAYREAGASKPMWRIEGRYDCTLHDALTGDILWQGALTLPDNPLPRISADAVCVLTRIGAV